MEQQINTSEVDKRRIIKNFFGDNKIHFCCFCGGDVKVIDTDEKIGLDSCIVFYCKKCGLFSATFGSELDEAYYQENRKVKGGK